MRIGLRSGTGDVHAPPVERHRRGVEPVVRADLLAERPREREVVADDDHVEVGALVPEQRVAHRAADQIGLGARGGVAHRPEARQPGDPASQAFAVDIELPGVIRGLSFA